MGAQLARNGDDDFVILERSGDIGGVWLDNNYPGAACDTEAHLYCYSFFPHLRVSPHVRGAEKLLGYAPAGRRLWPARASAPESRITEARWDGESRLWRFETRGGNATATYFVPAWGQLNQPSIPAFPGLETYRGALPFRALEWRRRTARQARGLRRKCRVGGAHVPEIAPEVAHLTVFSVRRTGSCRNQQVFTQEQLDAYEADPAAFEASRRHLHAFRETAFAARRWAPTNSGRASTSPRRTWRRRSPTRSCAPS